MLETLPLSLLALVNIVGPILLLAALVYGAILAGRRLRLGRARNAARNARTRALYQAEYPPAAPPESVPPPADERPTEDDLQRAALGPRGVPGADDPAKMTPQRAKKTPKSLEPGHTA